MIRKLTLAGMFALCSIDSDAATKYVNIAATGTNNGTSWTNAYTTLQAGLTGVVAGDSLWVANGIYKPSNVTTRSATFSLPSGVVVLGGFAGTETIASQRNFSTWSTILSGDIGSAGIHTDDVYRVITATTTSSSTRLDGFKIMYGNANNTLSNVQNGAGMYTSNSSLTVANCYFTENLTSGGGAFKQSGSGIVNISSCQFISNTSLGDGGALSAGDRFTSSTMNVLGCTFFDNQAEYGGACFFGGGNINMDRCIISGNSASASGVISIEDPLLTISNSLIVGNAAFNYVLYYSDFTNASVTSFINCTIAGNKNTNTAGSGFLMKPYANHVLRNNIIYGNAPADLYPTFAPIASDNVLQPGYSTGTGVDTTNPMFISSAPAASAPFNANGYNFRLTALTNAIDAGNNSYVSAVYNLDLDANARIQGGTVDKGAYETNYCTFAPTVIPLSPILCPGGTVSVTASGGTAYRWSNGSTAATTTVNAAGTYKVVATDAAGCRGTASSTVTASSINFTLNAPTTILCPGGTIRIKAIATVPLTYLWSTGATVDSIYVTAAGNFSVTGTGTDGCSVMRSISISAGTTPAPVVVLAGSAIKTSTTFTTYQWQLNGANIPGATGQNYTPTQNGTYTVIVTNAQGCTGTSAAFTISNVGVNEALKDAGISIYPNPATNVLFVQLRDFKAGTVEVNICDLTGRSVVTQRASNTLLSIPVGSLAQGFYLVKISMDGNTYSSKVLVQSH